MEKRIKHFHKIKIGKIELSGNCFLAPMAGFTDVGFRSLAKDFGASLTTTEMISVKALIYDNAKTLKMLEIASNERPVAVQIFGHDPQDFIKVIESGVLDKFDIIDINMGCPAPKIVNNGDGCALMKNLTLAEDVIKATVGATNKPVTVKFRAGWDMDNKNAVDFAKMCERAGASAITIHGRTRDQYYSGVSDPEIIKQCVEAVGIPVFANGDVNSLDDFNNLIERTGAAGVAIGRGSLGNLEIFADISKKAKNISKFEQIYSIFAVLHNFGYSENYILGQLRAHLIHFVKGMHLATEIKQKLLVIPTTAELLTELKKYLK